MLVWVLPFVNTKQILVLLIIFSLIKDYVASSFHADKDDFELDPFNKNGGLGKMWQLFGEKADEIIDELNELAA